MLKNIFIGVLLVSFLAACEQNEEPPKKWVLSKTLKIYGVNPIGIAEVDSKIWLSDGDHNRLVQIDENGNIVKIVDSLDRPMHIDALGETLFVPEYGKDIVETIDSKGRFTLKLNDSLDAPAGVSAFKNEKAIADFYNNRILYYNGMDWISFGEEGKAEGEFYYPTDVQITADKIWVADAYNNRIQVFDKKGNFLQMIGQDQKMNAATGIYVSEREVFITDFENNRVLVFDFDGNLKQELKDGISKPTDVLIVNDVLRVINYRTGDLLNFELIGKMPKS